MDQLRTYAVTPVGGVREVSRDAPATSGEHVLLAASPEEARQRAQAYFGAITEDAADAPDEFPSPSS